MLEAPAGNRRGFSYVATAPALLCAVLSRWDCPKVQVAPDATVTDTPQVVTWPTFCGQRTSNVDWGVSVSGQGIFHRDACGAAQGKTTAAIPARWVARRTPWHLTAFAGIGSPERGRQSSLVPIDTAPLSRERVLGIDPTIGISTARGGHALGVAGELAIAGIAPLAPLQAVAIRDGPGRRGQY